MNEITTLFNTFIFPVAMCIILLWFLYAKVLTFCVNIWESIQATLEKVTKTNESLSKTNEILAKKLEKKVDCMGEEIKEVSKKLDKLL